MKKLTIPGAQEQALFGKARAIESLIQDKAQVDEAIAAYQDLNKRFPNGMFKGVAEQRIEQLNKPVALAFYKELAQYKRTPPKPKVESPRSKLDNLGTLPENPTDELLVPKPPVRGDGSPSRPIEGVPTPSLTPAEPAVKVEVPKTVVPKTETVTPEAAKPNAPKLPALTPDAPPAEVPKKEAEKPAAPKKDK